MTAALCEVHLSRWASHESCCECAVINDMLEERGVVVPGDLLYGVRYNSQDDWGFKDLEEVALDIRSDSDEPSFTWILKLAGRWAAVRGWHDYTGWDCQSGLRTEWYESKEAAFRTLVDWERDVIALAEKNKEATA